jgi:hypothetical protein
VSVATVALLLAWLVGPSSGAGIKPTLSAAKQAVLREVYQVYPVTKPTKSPDLGSSHVSCTRLADRLYTCTWSAVVQGYVDGQLVHAVTYSGRAKVTFYKYAADARLFQVNCDDDGLGIFCK